MSVGRQKEKGVPRDDYEMLMAFHQYWKAHKNKQKAELEAKEKAEREKKEKEKAREEKQRKLEERIREEHRKLEERIREEQRRLEEKTEEKKKKKKKSSKPPKTRPPFTFLDQATVSKHSSKSTTSKKSWKQSMFDGRHVVVMPLEEFVEAFSFAQNTRRLQAPSEGSFSDSVRSEPVISHVHEEPPSSSEDDVLMNPPSSGDEEDDSKMFAAMQKKLAELQGHHHSSHHHRGSKSSDRKSRGSVKDSKHSHKSSRSNKLPNRPYTPDVTVPPVPTVPSGSGEKSEELRNAVAFTSFQRHQDILKRRALRSKDGDAVPEAFYSSEVALLAASNPMEKIKQRWLEHQLQQQVTNAAGFESFQQARKLNKFSSKQKPIEPTMTRHRLATTAELDPGKMRVVIPAERP